MSFDDIITKAQSKACTLSGRFGRKKGLEDLVFDVIGDPGTVVGDGDSDPLLSPLKGR